MCHLIRKNFDHPFYRIVNTNYDILNYNSVWLLGRKIFDIYRGRISSLNFPDYSYILQKLDIGYITQSETKKQSIDFEIPICDRWENRWESIQSLHIPDCVKGGYHISPPRSLSPIDFPLSDTMVSIPVIFNLDSVSFYDGLCVSVSNFVIPKPDTIKSLITDFYNLDPKHVFNMYEEVFEEIDEFYRENKS